MPSEAPWCEQNADEHAHACVLSAHSLVNPFIQARSIIYDTAPFALPQASLCTPVATWALVGMENELKLAL